MITNVEGGVGKMVAMLTKTVPLMYVKKQGEEN